MMRQASVVQFIEGVRLELSFGRRVYPYYSLSATVAVAIEDLAAHHVHMHINRMIRAQPRAHELVLYDFLSRLYRSQAARGG